MKSLQEAENKFREAEENLNNAKQNLEIAKTKAEQIRKNGSIISSQTAKALLESIEDEIKRLQQTNLSNLKLEEEKAISEVCQKLTSLSLTNALNKITKKLNHKLQQKVLKRKIPLLYLVVHEMARK